MYHIAVLVSEFRVETILRYHLSLYTSDVYLYPSNV